MVQLRFQLTKTPAKNNNRCTIFKANQHAAVSATDALASSGSYGFAWFAFQASVGLPVT